MLILFGLLTRVPPLVIKQLIFIRRYENFLYQRGRVLSLHIEGVGPQSPSWLEEDHFAGPSAPSHLAFTEQTEASAAAERGSGTDDSKWKSRSRNGPRWDQLAVRNERRHHRRLRETFRSRSREPYWRYSRRYR